MKKLIINILILAIIVPTFLGAFQPKVAEASCIPGLLPTAVGGSNFKISDCINDVATTVMLPLVGKFLQVSGFLFGLSVKANLYIGDLVDNPSGNGSTVIGEVWKNIRDISSIFFIGMLLYASFSMILGVGGSNVNQLIVSMVLAGLLMNFSLFGTRLVIDASNTAALVFYNAITPSGGPGQPRFGQNGITSGLGSAVDSIGNYGLAADAFIDDGGISNNIMAALQLQTLFAQSANKTNPAQWILQSITVIIGGSIMMIVAGLAFLAGAIMFVYRLITLILLMAFSPLPVIAMILPQTSKYAKEWSSTLMSQCLFGPIYLFLMYVALKIATDARLIGLFGAGGKKGLVDVFTGAYVGPLLQYTIVIMLMYYALVAAKSYGGNGADIGLKWMKNFQSWGQNAVSGALGRNIIGRGARALGNSYDAALSESGTGAKGWVSNGISRLVIKPAAKVAGIAGVERQLRGAVKGVETAKYGGQSLEGEEKAQKARLKEIKVARETGARSAKIQTALEVLKDTSASAADTVKAHNDIKDALKTMSNDEIKGLDKDLLKNEDFVARLSVSQFETATKNESFSETDKADIKKARGAGITKMINNPVSLTETKDGKTTTKDYMGPEELLKGKITDLTKLSTENLEKLAPYLNREQYKNLLKDRDGDSNLSEETKDKIKEARKKFLEEKSIVGTTPLPDSKEGKVIGRLVKSMSTEELLAATGNNIEKLKKLAPYIQVDHLKGFVGALGKDARDEIALAILELNGDYPGTGFARRI